ncbi:MAG: recombinase family protein [Pseudomonadales bacterium]|nr:recombinase family protein [Pseudomonadales bacterium]
MKSVIFCRVSSKEQEETGYSLPAQEKFLREYGDKQGLEVKKVFAISESAAGKSQRKVFEEMITYVRKQNICAIIVETTDRLTRNFSDVPTIDQWITETKPPDSLSQRSLCPAQLLLFHEWFMAG